MALDMTIYMDGRNMMMKDMMTKPNPKSMKTVVSGEIQLPFSVKEKTT